MIPGRTAATVTVATGGVRVNIAVLNMARVSADVVRTACVRKNAG